MWITNGSQVGHIRITLWVSGSNGSTGVTHFQPWLALLDIWKGCVSEIVAGTIPSHMCMNPAIAEGFLLKESQSPVATVIPLIESLLGGHEPSNCRRLSVKGNHSRHEPSNCRRLSVKGNHSRHEPSNCRRLSVKGNHSRHEPSNCRRLSVKGNHSRHEPSNCRRLSVKGNHSRHEPSNCRRLSVKEITVAINPAIQHRFYRNGLD